MPAKTSSSKRSRKPVRERGKAATSPKKPQQQFVTAMMFVGEQNGRAGEAVMFYTSLFRNSKLIAVEPYGPGEGQGEREGALKYARFSLDGHEFVAMDSGGPHQFTFTPAISTMVHCETAAEVERLFSNLANGGTVLMELGKYPFSDSYGWVQDQFGVSWQVMLV